MMCGQQWSSATASHILFKGSDAPTRAAEVLAEIEAGRNFEETAADLSACPSGRRSGGSLGSFMPGKMVPAFDAVVFSENTVLKKMTLVQTSHGTHILRVNSREGFGSSEGYSPEKGLQLGGYKTLARLVDAVAEPPAPSPPAQIAAHSPNILSEQTIAPSTARLWALHAPDRQRAMELLEKEATGSALTVEEWISLRAILSQLLLTLVS